MNTFYHGDCKFVMNREQDIPAGTVDLIYLDPPFFTGKIQKAKDQWHPEAMEISFNDKKDYWGEHMAEMRERAPKWFKSIPRSDEFKAYLFYMFERLEACHKVLKPTGSIYLHCDEKASHYLKMLMDNVFGNNNYRNEIIWVKGREGSGTTNLPTEYQSILLYKRDTHIKPIWNPPKQGYKLSTVKNIQPDERGWYYTRGKGIDPRGVLKTYVWDNPSTSKDNVLNTITNPNYAGALVGDVWYIPQTPQRERVGYPTQKPIALLERIILSSSDIGNIVLDPFCGCGTAIVAAQKHGRQWIGIDINKVAYTVSKDRFHQLKQEPLGKQAEHKEATYISRDLDEVLAMEYHDFEVWVNQFYGATKPKPERMVDGITKDGIPIQTKAQSKPVDYDTVEGFSADIQSHPRVSPSIKQGKIVSQSGFTNEARRAKSDAEALHVIVIDLIEPKHMLEGKD